MATLTLQLDSAESLRANWPAILNTPGKLQELLDSEVVTVAMEARINAQVVWREYGCQVDLRTFYRAFGKEIAEKNPFTRVNLGQQATQDLAVFVLSQNPEVGAAFLEANDGVPLEILPPYVAPVVVPEIPETDPEGDGNNESGSPA
jgi:hypothetical protein